MIEQGFVSLVLGTIGNPQIGMFAVELPDGYITAANPQAITYRSILMTPTNYVGGQDSLTCWEVQIDCHGIDMPNALTLSRLVDGVLRGGYSGALTDPDSTVVQWVKRLPGVVDGFNPDSRTYVRSLEYEVLYEQS